MWLRALAAQTQGSEFEFPSILVKRLGEATSAPVTQDLKGKGQKVGWAGWGWMGLDGACWLPT